MCCIQLQQSEKKVEIGPLTYDLTEVGYHHHFGSSIMSMRVYQAYHHIQDSSNIVTNIFNNST